MLDRGIRTEKISIPVGQKDQTSAILSLPEGPPKKIATIVAHGAGNDMYNPLIASFSEGLATAGYPTLRFNFLYKERGRKAPDTAEVLVETWKSAYRFLKEASNLTIDSVIAAGKSLGGRIAAQMAAEGLLPANGLIFLGYPLHPAGDPERLRDAHLYRIKAPMLFFAGTRDLLCDMEKLKAVLNRLRVPWELHTIDGGDHSFHVPKSMKTTDREIQERIVKITLGWLSRSARQGLGG